MKNSNEFDDNWAEIYEYIQPSKYTGTVNVTYSGVPCLNWTSVANETFTFSDVSIKDALNYCRDPLNLGYLWCYEYHSNRRTKCNVTCKSFFHFKISYSNPNALKFVLYSNILELVNFLTVIENF